MTSMSNVEQWKDMLSDTVTEAVGNGGFQRGELKEATEMIASEYKIPSTKVKSYYYTIIDQITEEVTGEPRKRYRKTKSEILGNNESLENPMINNNNSVSDEIEQALKSGQVVYAPGQMLEVEVTNHKDYGVFVKTLDGNEFSGLIHVTEMTGDFIDRTTDYFDIGDRLLVKVKSFVDRRLDLSVRGLPIPKIERKREANARRRARTLNDSVMLESSSIGSSSIVMNNPVPEVKEEKVALTYTQPVAEINTELDEIIKHLNTIVGVLSPDAQEKLEEMISEMGVFKFTMAMSKATQRMDIGLMLLNEIKQKANGGL